MTTLPQTTTIRLPRPAGQGPLAIGPQMALGHATANVSHMTAADVWRILRTNFWLIVALVGLSAVGGFALNRFVLERFPRYTATGYIQISGAYFPTDLLGRGQQAMV